MEGNTENEDATFPRSPVQPFKGNKGPFRFPEQRPYMVPGETAIQIVIRLVASLL